MEEKQNSSLKHYESSHGIFRLARQIDMELTASSEEFYCYNIGYLTEELHKLLANYNKKITP